MAEDSKDDTSSSTSSSSSGNSKHSARGEKGVRTVKNHESSRDGDSKEPNFKMIPFLWIFKDKKLEYEFLQWYYGNNIQWKFIATIIISVALWSIFIYSDTLKTYPPPGASDGIAVWYGVPSKAWYYVHIVLRAAISVLGIFFFLPLVLIFRKHLLIQEVIMMACMTSFTMVSNFLSTIAFNPNAEGFPEGKLIAVIVVYLMPLQRVHCGLINTVLSMAAYIIGLVAIQWAVVWKSAYFYLNVLFMLGAHLFASVFVSITEWYYRRVFITLKRLDRQKIESEQQQKRSAQLLENILPRLLVSRVKQITGISKFLVQSYDNAAVIFTDIKGFTQWSSTCQPQEIVSTLNIKFTLFDSIARHYRLEKIKTIGDAFFAVSGIEDLEYMSKLQLTESEAHPRKRDMALRAVIVAFRFMQAMSVVNQRQGTQLEIRAGISMGSVFIAVQGTFRKLGLDAFGHTVLEAEELEANGNPMQPCCAKQVWELVKDVFEFAPPKLLLEGNDSEGERPLYGYHVTNNLSEPNGQFDEALISPQVLEQENASPPMPRRQSLALDRKNTNLLDSTPVRRSSLDQRRPSLDQRRGSVASASASAIEAAGDAIAARNRNTLKRELHKTRLLQFFCSPRTQWSYLSYNHTRSRVAIIFMLAMSVLYFAMVIANVSCATDAVIFFRAVGPLAIYFIITGLSILNFLFFLLPIINRFLIIGVYANIASVVIALILPLATLFIPQVMTTLYVSTTVWALTSINCFPSGMFILKVLGALAYLLFTIIFRTVVFKLGLIGADSTFTQWLTMVVACIIEWPIAYYMSNSTMMQYVSQKRLKVDIEEVQREQRLNDGLISSAIPSLFHNQLFEIMSQEDKSKQPEIVEDAKSIKGKKNSDLKYKVKGNQVQPVAQELQEKAAEPVANESSTKSLSDLVFEHTISKNTITHQQLLCEMVESGTICFIKLCGFDHMLEFAQADELMLALSTMNAIFTRFDEIASQIGITKIKSTQSIYFMVSGLSLITNSDGSSATENPHHHGAVEPNPNYRRGSLSSSASSLSQKSGSENSIERAAKEQEQALTELDQRYAQNPIYEHLSHTHQMLIAALQFKKSIGDLTSEFLAKLKELREQPRTSSMGRASNAFLQDSTPMSSAHVTDIGLKIGMNQGKFVSGVLGKSKWLFDCFGDTVNTASRLMATCEINQVQVCEGPTLSTLQVMKQQVNESSWVGPKFDLKERGKVYMKGKGELPTFYIMDNETSNSTVVP